MRLTDPVASYDKRIAAEGQEETLALLEDVYFAFSSSTAKIDSQDAVGPPLGKDSGKQGAAPAQILSSNRLLLA